MSDLGIIKESYVVDREKFACMCEEDQWELYSHVLERLGELERKFDELDSELKKIPKVNTILEKIHQSHGPYLVNVSLCNHPDCIDARESL